MKPWIYLAGFVGAAAIGHAAVVLGTPYLITGVVMNRMSQHGQVVNRFQFGSRTTEASRQVVRPSPDLVYSSCVFDLSKGPVRVVSKPWGDYMSISVFQANGDNIYAVNDREAPRGVDFVLAKPGQGVASGAAVILSPSDRGIILDRRLAPTAERFAIADQVRRSDLCAAIP